MHDLQACLSVKSELEITLENAVNSLSNKNATIDQLHISLKQLKAVFE